MRAELYDALRAATEGEFELLGELDCDDGWIAYLAAAPRDGELAILILHETPDDDGQFDLQVVRDLDGSLRVGKTSCPACGAMADGWPRFCGGCRRDLSGIAVDAAVPGSSPAELLEAVRDASAGVYQVLGAMRHAEGGGAMYFARENGGRIVGLVMERDSDGELSLVRSWAYDADALAGVEPTAVWTPEEPTLPSGFAAVPAEEPGLAYAAVPAEEPGPGITGAEPVPPALLYGGIEGIPPRRGRRGGLSRPLAYGAVVVLLVTAGVLAAAAMRRARAQPVTTPVPPVATAPVPAPPPVQAFTDTATVAVPAPAPPRQEVPPAPRPRPRPQPPAAQPPAREPVGPSPEADRRAVLDAVARYASAVESRQMDRIRAAYPGISAGEADDLGRWLRRIRNLTVTYSVTAGPEVQGDGATVTFSLSMAYDGQRRSLPTRGTLRRSGDGWTLQELRAP